VCRRAPALMWVRLSARTPTQVGRVPLGPADQRRCTRQTLSGRTRRSSSVRASLGASVSRSSARAATDRWAATPVRSGADGRLREEPELSAELAGRLTHRRRWCAGRRLRAYRVALCVDPGRCAGHLIVRLLQRPDEGGFPLAPKRPRWYLELASQSPRLRSGVWRRYARSFPTTTTR